MYRLKFKIWTFLALIIAGTLTISSCTKEENAAPVVTSSVTSFTGKIGEIVSTSISAAVAGEYKDLKITKYLGTDVDNTYGTSGTLTVTSALPYNFDYTLNGEGAETPVRFQFVVSDAEGKTGEANLVITTELTLKYVLTKFNWRLNAKIGKILASDAETDFTLDCEKDNVFTFNEDGTMSIDYGPLTAAGGGSCDFDGLNPYVGYTISADEKTLTKKLDNIFAPGDFTFEVYTIVEYSLTDLKTTTPIDLSVFGGILYDWKYNFKATPK